MLDHLRTLPGFFYLAGPYSANPSALVWEHRRCAMHLHSEKLRVFCTISQWHDAAHVYKSPTDAKFWEEYNFAMLDAAGKLILLELTGWQKSKGTQDELAHAFERDYPVWGLDPEGFRLRRLGDF